jgi:hypothetical protein
VIEHLVKRDGVRKGGGSAAGSPIKKGKGKGKKKAVISEDESEAAMSGVSDAESSVLSDLVSDEEVEVSEVEEEEEEE